MLTTLIICMVAIVLAWCARYKNGNYALFASFAVIFLFLALRYDYGIDYMAYYDVFNAIGELSFSQLGQAAFNDWGYVFSNWLFAQLGLNFYFYVAAVAFLQCAVLYNVIKENVPSEFQWLAVAIYLFNPTFMLIQCSAIRQTIAIFLFLYSIRFIIRRKPLKFIVCIILGGLFHRSCLFMMPIYLVCGPFKMKSYIKLSVACAYWVLFFYGGFFIDQLIPVINYINPKYLKSYNVAGQVGTGFFIMFYFICLLWWLYSINAVDEKINVYMKVSIIFFVTLVLGIWLMMFARIGYYFSMTLVVTIPLMVSKISKPLYQVAATGVFFLLYFYRFYLHFQDELCRNYYIYKTFFE